MQRSLLLPAPRAKRAIIDLPGDKSVSHRVFLLSAVASGTTHISGANDGADVRATIRALRALGVSIERSGDVFLVHGTEKLRVPNQPIDCANSGTTMRLLAGLLAGRVSAALDGDASLRRRPMRRVVEPLRHLGAQVDCSPTGTPPLRVRAGAPLHGGRVRLALPSAQVESALMLAALHASAPTSIVTRWKVRDHMHRLFRDFRARLIVRGRELRIAPGRLRSPGRVKIGGDLSGAIYFVCAAAVVPGSHLVLRRVGVNPTRTAILGVLRSMGVDIRVRRRTRAGREPVADLVVRGGNPLRGVSIPAALVPELIDEIPALCALASAASGKFEIRGATELRYKESDRIATTAALLRAFDVRVDVRTDGLVVQGGRPLAPPRSVHTSGDHRIGMAAAILVAAGRAPVRIVDSACIQTSFPGFARTWRRAFGA